MSLQLKSMYEFQSRRLEAELSLHWQRIQISTVGLIGVITATGYLMLQHRCTECGALPIAPDGIDPQALHWLTVAAITLTWLVAWYLVVLTISGAYWIRVNEQKLGVIEEQLFGMQIYNAFHSHDTKTVSLTMFTKLLYTLIGGIALFLLLIALFHSCSASAGPLCVLMSGHVFPCSLIASVVISSLWIYFAMWKPSKKVFGTVICHKSGHYLIDTSTNRRSKAKDLMDVQLKEWFAACKAGIGAESE